MPRHVLTSARKAPRQDRARKTVEAILKATAHILVREGYDRASTNKVARRAGVSIGSLYQYFPSKEALVAALIDRHVDQMIAVLSENLAEVASAPLPAAVRQVLEAMLQAHRVDPRLHRVLIEQVPRVGRLGRVAYLEERATDLVRFYLAPRRAEVVPERLDVVTYVLVRAVKSVTEAFTGEDPAPFADEVLLDELCALVLRYLTGPSVGSPATKGA